MYVVVVVAVVVVAVVVVVLVVVVVEWLPQDFGSRLVVDGVARLVKSEETPLDQLGFEQH